MVLNEQAGGNLFETVQDNYPVALFELIDLMEMPISIYNAYGIVYTGDSPCCFLFCYLLRFWLFSD